MFVKDKDKDFGVNLNCSIVGNCDDGYTGGAHVTTSDGEDFSVEVTGATSTQVANALTSKIVQQAVESTFSKQAQLKKAEEEKAKKAHEEKKAKLDALYKHVAQLEDEIGCLESELYDDDMVETSKPLDNHVTLDDLLNSDKDDFFDYLDSLLG